jgi:hypothetical protein
MVSGMKIGAARKPARKPEELSDTAVEETLQAMEELDKGKSKTFDNIDELFDDLACD